MLVPQFSISAGSTAASLLSSLLLFKSVQGMAVTVPNNTLTGFPPCDALLATNLSHTVVIPTEPQFQPLVDVYWALNTRKAPWCFVLPSTTDEVSQVVTTLRDAGEGAGDWHIALRAGAHGSDNSNNIEDGVTIDLSQLNATVYDESTKVASVSGGSLWQQVYDTLDPHGVSVAGGREGIVGVGGFTLGGGNTFYTAKHGFACDGVVNFEVVLASGETVNANEHCNADLWRALKGGGANFGIVTKFDLATFPAHNMSYAVRTISGQHTDEVIDAVVNFANLDQSFHDDAMLASFSYTPGKGINVQVIEANTMDANSTAFDDFNKIPELVPMTTQRAPLREVAETQAVAGATLNAGNAITLANDVRVLGYVLDQHASLVEDLKTTFGPKQFSTTLEFQPLPAYFAEISEQRGGNMLGLKPDSDNKLLFALGVTLLGPNATVHEPVALAKVCAMIERIQAFAKSIGKHEEFVYLNYAKAPQNPLGSYGAANVAHIKKTARKYDPDGFFQERVPGGFKISRVT